MGVALIIVAGLAIPAAVATRATAVTTVPASGVDVSPFTTVNSWTLLRQAGSSFAGVEATFAQTAETTYAADVKAAAAAGLYVMPYAFVFPYDPKGNGTVAQQAAAAVSVVDSVTDPAYKSSDLMLPLVVDIENDPYYEQDHTTQCYGLTPQAMVDWLKTYIADVSALGKTPIIYTNAPFWDTCTGNSTAFSGYPLWLASYGVTIPALPTGWGNYTFWQYTSSGTVNGIKGPTDLDYLGPVVQVSQAGAPIAPVQLQTLTSLDGTQVTYAVPAAGSPGALPPGLTMSPSGQVTGTPLVSDRGQQYTVTVTPSAGAVPVTPASLTFTWDVSGAITVNSPGNRRTPAGTPVALQISGYDPNAGYTPSYAATGLPTGLSMSSSGLITGWPSAPGTYDVTVYASDAFGGTGSMLFTWTVPAVADSGFAGQLRQVGGTGKCLNDPSSGTANGTLVNLWSCDGHGNQQWTVVKDGTIRVLGKCLAASGTSVVLWACSSGFSNQQWQAGTDGELVNAQSGKCLYFAGAAAANGNRPTMAACANTTIQSGEHWYRPAGAVFSGEPGKCLAGAGSAVELAACADTAAQRWAAQSDGTLRLGGQCLTEAAAAAGSALSLGPCAGTAATKWQLSAAGPLATELVSAASGLCVTAPSAASGVPLVIESCAATPAQTWRVG